MFFFYSLYSIYSILYSISLHLWILIYAQIFF